MRKALILALGLAVVGLSGAAQAQTLVTSDVTADTTWGVAPNACPIILDGPIFVTGADTELTILAGCVVRGQPRTAAPVSGSTVGVPGSLIVTQGAKINADGSPTAPIIFTTAAIDNNGDGVGDTTGSFLTPATCTPTAGTSGPCTLPGGQTFLDDDPAGDPLSPLASDGTQNISLWGGVAILGSAPTNYSIDVALSGLGVGYGQNILEGVDFLGFPAALGVFGGDEVNDDSGTLRYVSIRHAGDTLNDGDELNCLTLGAVGRNTTLQFVECHGNFDDGFEMFGGTVDGQFLTANWIGDDTFDFDAGYTGTLQFVSAIMPTFDQDSGATYGSRSGDKCTEWDGTDRAEFTPPGGFASSNNRPLSSDLAPTADQPWPYPSSQVINFTCIGSSPAANAAADPNSANRLVQMRNGFAGTLSHGLFVNSGTSPGLEVVDGDDAAGAWTATFNNARGSIDVICSTFDDVTGVDATAVANGNAESSSATDNAFINFPPFAGLSSEASGCDYSVGSGKLADVACSVDHRPVNVVATGGCNPAACSFCDPVTFRGAYAAGADFWHNGWSAVDAVTPGGAL